ncbi:MAG: response regulator [Planctomycetota bacterium]|jgi:two-component system phosphate regulon response regulator PhoB
MPKSKILVIEDDRALAKVLEYNLLQNGFEVILSSDGQDGLQQARTKQPSLVLLDLMIPVIDGLEVCKRLRAASETRDLPIIMLTAKAEETDQVVGYSLGADDYVTKPFSVKVLIERVKSLLRRDQLRQNAEGEDVITRLGVSIDRLKHRATLNGEPVDLTPSEFRLLETLIRQPGRAFDRTELVDSALGSDAMVLERTIDVHIRSLRKKFGDQADLIETVRGVGYRFRDAVPENA